MEIRATEDQKVAEREGAGGSVREYPHQPRAILRFEGLDSNRAVLDRNDAILGDELVNDVGPEMRDGETSPVTVSAVTEKSAQDLSPQNVENSEEAETQAELEREQKTEADIQTKRSHRRQLLSMPLNDLTREQLDHMATIGQKAKAWKDSITDED